VAKCPAIMPGPRGLEPTSAQQTSERRSTREVIQCSRAASVPHGLIPSSNEDPTDVGGSLLFRRRPPFAEAPEQAARPVVLRVFCGLVLEVPDEAEDEGGFGVEGDSVVELEGVVAEPARRQSPSTSISPVTNRPSSVNRFMAADVFVVPGLDAVLTSIRGHVS